MLKRLAKLEREVAAIKERNARVEADKAWETSWTRRAVVFIATYAVIALFLFAAGVPEPLLNALIPALAFVLSTATLGFVKEWWKKNAWGR